ncbi:MAG: DUF1598 domain-containing protein [Planctomycetales bacterium]|nr:DUF1598 domain-containing protein [Planctomycetales bacterium]
MRVLMVGIVLALAAWPAPNIFGQSSSGDSSGSGGLGADGLAGSGNGVAGGAAMADFQTLINLIETTIDPLGWAVAGGAGENSITPYPSGVYVDPRGHLSRVVVEPLIDQEHFIAPDQPRHPWRTESRLRTISLHALDQALQQSFASGVPPGAEILKLAGLSRIEYVYVAPEQEDVFLAGPAGDPGFGFHLQDLAIVTASVDHNTSPLGCTIEASDAGVIAAQQYLNQPGVMKQLSQHPRAITAKIEEAIGPHHVHVFGISPTSGTALALVDADEHMKQVGFGAVRTAPRIKNYFDHLDPQANVPPQSLIRWWFAYSDESVKANPDRRMFQLPKQSVCVLSEQQWMSQNGRAPTGQHDAASDAFASEFTANIPHLRAQHPSYARLCSVFETALALQLALPETGQPSFRAWFPHLCAIGNAQEDDDAEPKTVAGLATSHRLPNGSVVAVVSGGVKVDPVLMADNRAWEYANGLSHTLLPQEPKVPSLSHDAWWWD